MIKWIQTDKHIFGVIYSEHHEQLVPFATYTDPDGNDPIGKGYPYILTEWGLRGADYSLIKHIKSCPDHFYKRRPKDDPVEWTHEYFIALITKEDD